MQNLPVASREEWLNILRNTHMLPVTKLVGYILAQYARADGQQARPTQRQLAADIGREMRRVRRALTALVEAGLIECTRPAAPRRPAVYRLTKPRPTSTSPRLDT